MAGGWEAGDDPAELAANELGAGRLEGDITSATEASEMCMGAKGTATDKVGVPLRVQSVSLVVGEAVDGVEDGGSKTELKTDTHIMPQSATREAEFNWNDSMQKVGRSLGAGVVVRTGGAFPVGKERRERGKEHARARIPLHPVDVSLELPAVQGESYSEQVNDKLVITCSPRPLPASRRSSASPWRAEQRNSSNSTTKGYTIIPSSPRIKSCAIERAKPRPTGSAVVPPLDLTRLGMSGTGAGHEEQEETHHQETKSPAVDDAPTAESRPASTATQAVQSNAEAAKSIIKTWSPRRCGPKSTEELIGEPVAADMPLSVRTQQGRFTTKSRRVGRAGEGPAAQELYPPFRPTHRATAGAVNHEVGISTPHPAEWTQRGTRFGVSPRFQAHATGADTRDPLPVWTGDWGGVMPGEERTGYSRPRAASMPDRYKPPSHGTLAHSLWSKPYRGTSALRSQTSRDGSSTHFLACMASPGPGVYAVDRAIGRKQADTSKSLRGSAPFASSAVRTLPHEPVTFSGKFVKPAEICYSSLEGDARAWHRQRSSYTGKMVCAAPRRCMRSERDSGFVHPRPRAEVLDWRDTVPVDEATVGPGRYDPPRWPDSPREGWNTQALRGTVIGAGFSSRPSARQRETDHGPADLSP